MWCMVASQQLQLINVERGVRGERELERMVGGRSPS